MQSVKGKHLVKSEFSDDDTEDDGNSLSNAFDNHHQHHHNKQIRDSIKTHVKGNKNNQQEIIHHLLSSLPDNTGGKSSNQATTPPIKKLNLDELDFKPWCEIESKEAISAIHRASTQRCKEEIANVTCLAQNGFLYPKHLPRFCPFYGKFELGIHFIYLFCLILFIFVHFLLCCLLWSLPLLFGSISLR